MSVLHWLDDSILYRFALDIVQKLQEAGYLAYFAGGCVRDALMGNQPNDYDVATNATPDQVSALFGSKHTMIIGAAFGVACVHRRIDRQRYEVEVATFRSDGAYSDGRRPDWVTFSNPQEDAQRRDFSINGMFYDPIAKVLHDFVGGQLDLKHQVIRAIGAPEQRIAEDKLRMLRAIRFASRFGFHLEELTAQAIASSAKDIRMVSGERIAAEMKKLLETKAPGFGLRKAFELGLLEVLLPEVYQAWLDTKIRQRTLSIVESLKTSGSFASRMAALYWFTSREVRPQASHLEPALEDLKGRWRLSNQDIEAIQFCLNRVNKLLSAHELAWSEIQPLLIVREIKPAMELARALVAVEQAPSSGFEICRAALEWPKDKLDPAPLLSGNDLQRLGYKPGPNFAKMLHFVRVEQLDGRISSSNEAVEFLASLGAMEEKE